MGLEQFAVGFLICLVTVVCAMLFSIFTNFTTDHMDDDGFGYFITMFFSMHRFRYLPNLYFVYEWVDVKWD